jgi:ABC-2 type transport system permease protein
MFAIANVIKQYYSNNFIKVIRNLPYNITVHILSLCLSRLIVLFSVLILLILCSFYLFHVKISFELILLYLSGIVLGLTIFTFFGLCISFSSNTGGGRGAISFIYYIMLFLSNALFSIGKVNPVLNIISHIFPLTPLTAYMRGEYTQLPVILIWLAGLIIIFNIIYSKKQIKR